MGKAIKTVSKAFPDGGYSNWKTCRYGAAETGSQESLAIRRQHLRNDDERITASIWMLALVLSYQGNHADAEALNRQTLVIKEGVLGKTHPDTLTSVYCLAHVPRNRREYDKASKLYERARTGYRLSLGPDHSTT
ncbi:uncharacterized protein RAG0_02819 [Rhynchosporium agropyri]|uniref:Kinesin light chain n=1 Tax=Rhynchosporium agropyri TaxID=914238 RepID=A0A1E1K3E1_9HELO|nr:uncharacterized protein RAG0_02819 [Rhynchosporium agropyri]